MSNSSARDNDISKLHPAIRNSVIAIKEQLDKENIPFDVLEAFRTPERQANLFAQGRTKPGNVVTWAGPWRSIHQYGLAVDFVLKINGQWSWKDTGVHAKHWTRMHEIAKDHGMTPIFNSKGRLIEKPHIQLIGVSSKKLHAGHYPEGGDAVWAEHLAELIDNWSGSGAPPPKPALAPQRPALDAADVAEMQDQGTPAASSSRAPLGDSQAEAKFQRLHTFVKKWEGGFVNHERDNGGATNMGITLETLAAWRKRDVTVSDVQHLQRAEADAIFRANYFTATRCAELPERTAMVVYNGAVLHGPKRSIMFLQKGFNDLGLNIDGKPLKVDGVLGRITIGAVQATDPSVLASAYMDVQDAHLWAHEDFDVFGTGWMNRQASLREFLTTLPKGAGKRPANTMTVSDSRAEFDQVLKTILDGTDEVRSPVVTGALASLLADDTGDSARRKRRKALLRMLVAGVDGDDAVAVTPIAGKPPLTPVNAALGEGVGRLLNGKKSVTGILAMFATVILPQTALTGDIVNFLDTHGQAILTVAATFTGWGFLGKIDKAIRTVGVLR